MVGQSEGVVGLVFEQVGGGIDVCADLLQFIKCALVEQRLTFRRGDLATGDLLKIGGLLWAIRKPLSLYSFWFLAFF